MRCSDITLSSDAVCIPHLRKVIQFVLQRHDQDTNILLINTYKTEQFVCPADVCACGGELNKLIRFYCVVIILCFVFSTIFLSVNNSVLNATS